MSQGAVRRAVIASLQDLSHRIAAFGGARRVKPGSRFQLPDLLESRLLFTATHWYHVSFPNATPYSSQFQEQIVQGISSTTDTGTLTVSQSEGDVAATSWPAAVQSFIAGVSVQIGGGTAITNISDSSHFNFTTAGKTGHTSPYNEPSLGEGAASGGTIGLGKETKVIAFEDGSDADFNDAYFPIKVAQVLVPSECPCCNPGGPAHSEPSASNSPNTTSNPIDYSDGAVHLNSTDLSSGGFGTGWSASRSWTNRLGQATNNAAGNGMDLNQLPTLVQSGTSVKIIENGIDSLAFDPNGSGGFVAEYFATDTLRPIRLGLGRRV